MITWNAEKTARALSETAAAAYERARAVCPVRTGRLRGSISGAVIGNTAVVSANTDYAVFVELGGGRRAPRPFMQEALSAAAEKAPEIFMNEIFGGRGA